MELFNYLNQSFFGNGRVGVTGKHTSGLTSRVAKEQQSYLVYWKEWNQDVQMAVQCEMTGNNVQHQVFEMTLEGTLTLNLDSASAM